jgi:hypothetical protein
MSLEVFPDHPVHEQITRRWNPYSFDGRSVTDEDLRLLHDRCQPGDRWRVHDLVAHPNPTPNLESALSGWADRVFRP